MNLLNSAQNLVLLALTLAAFAACVFALVDAARRPAQAFEYAGKRTKRFWTLVLGGATLAAFVAIGGSLLFFAIIGVVASGVYLADVRPAVRTYGGGGGGGRGPYGGW